MEKLTTYATGKTKREIAASFGISQAYLSQLLSGVRSPSLTLAFRIEEVTGGEVPAKSWTRGTER